MTRHSGRLPFLLRYVRIEFLIRTMLTETWAPEAWPVVKHEFIRWLKVKQKRWTDTEDRWHRALLEPRG